MEKNQVTTDWMQVSELEIIYNAKIKASERPQIKCSSDAHKLFLASWNMDKIELLEQFKVMPLNKGNRVLGICEISSGSIDHTTVDPRLIFGLLLKVGATQAIICHNHPSANVKPSEADKQITMKLKEGGKLLDIKILDHIVLTPETYYSFADEGEI
ncbi:JAB domain-containing protein [Pinibacter aurantiacus]|uniref:JAB domain-containing protein n=1 Tax=Pinibacter aurantiacus TaxID=2851599 RepID=A0A9E2S634_9BACT|nr:JAB domain-containing protein [Pinibacter aurantiacus]MBV4357338.1 JAB domain-containing protein [Pinibacter aurantiacus]